MIFGKTVDNACVCSDIVGKFSKFLDSKRTDNKEDTTHTRVGKPSGKYCIKTKKDYDKFMELYASVCELVRPNGQRWVSLNLSEKQQEIGPLMTDYDFEFDKEHVKRMYKLSDIKYVTKKINELIKKYVIIDDEDIIAYVTEKDSPSIEYDKISDEMTRSDIEKQPIKKVKDGFHICYMIPFTRIQRYMIYDELMTIIKSEDGFKNIGMSNSYDSIIDISTIDRNNWMMYGSRKTIHKNYPSKMYSLTHIFNYELEEQSLKEFMDEMETNDIIRFFSVRQFGVGGECKTHDEHKSTEHSIAEKYYNKSKKSKSSQLTNIMGGSVITNVSVDKPKTKQQKIIMMAKKLTNILSIERSKDYNDWIRVGWTLHNIDPSLYDTFITFSQKCLSSFDKRGCDKVWNDARDNGYTIASLHWWAQIDNPEEYHKIIWESIDKIYELAKSGRPVNIAIIVHELYKYRFKCTGIDGKHINWYEFKNHRWTNIPGASALRHEITMNVSKKIADMGYAYLSKMYDSHAEDQDIIRKTGQKIIELTGKLGETSFINNVITECEHQFLETDFEEKLDSKTNLIGFNNGVYDLDIGEFRNGLPEDYVSLTTGYDWKDYDKTENQFGEIDDYLRKLMPNHEVRKYLLKQLASYMDGRIIDQQFAFWTGKGCHSADTKILMYNGSIKMAQDVKIGDLLMGDDSLPRRVGGLFTGIQDMYEIKLNDNSSYVVNANHRLALKSIFDGLIECDEISNTYIVTYHKYENLIPVKHEKYFKFKCNSDNEEMVHKMANDYLNKKREKRTTIRYGMIIPVKVIDYIKLDECITRYYKNFRNTIMFEQQPVLVDPYKIGLNLNNDGIPSQYKFNSIQVRKCVLAGIIDKFGCIKNNTVCIQTNDYSLLGDIVFLCRSIGIHVDQFDKELMLYSLFEDINTRKLKIPKCCYARHDLTYDFQVENIGIGRFYGFSVDKNERYVLQNFVITYNSNGKTMFTKLIKNAFGNYYDILEHTVLTRARGSASNATPELADKQGKRFIVMQEPEEEDKLHVGFMKQMSGGDQITARALFKNNHKYNPQFKLVMVCNNLPDIHAQDEGTWRRIVVIEFKSEFIDYKPIKENQFWKDKTIEAKMLKWHSAFMWMLLKEYYPLYKKEGLEPPEDVKCKTNKFRNDNDSINEFINITYDVTKKSTDKIQFSVFCSSFRSWFKTVHGKNCPENKVIRNYIEKSSHFTLDDRGHMTGLKEKSSDEIDEDL